MHSFGTFDYLAKSEFPRWETKVVVQQFTSQELAKLKAADPDDVVSVRAGQAIELIEQYDQLSREYARVSADNVRLEEEIAEYKSNVAVLEQRVNRHARESHIQRSIRTHCGTEGQLGGAAAGPARSSRRKSTLLAVPSLLDEKEFLQQMRSGLS